MARPRYVGKDRDDGMDLIEFLKVIAELGKTVSVLGSVHQQSQRDTAEAPLSHAGKVEDVKAKQIANVQAEESGPKEYASKVAGQLERGEAHLNVGNLPEVRAGERTASGLSALGKVVPFPGAAAATGFLEGEQRRKVAERRESPDIGRYHAKEDLLHVPGHEALTQIRVAPSAIDKTPVPYGTAVEMSGAEQKSRWAHGRNLEVSAQDSREAIALRGQEGVNAIRQIDANLRADMVKSAWSKFSELTARAGVGGTFDEAGLAAFQRTVLDGTELVVGDETAFAALIKVSKMDTYRLPWANDDGTYDLKRFVDRVPATFTEYALSEKFLRGRSEVQLRESMGGLQQVPGAIELMYGSEELFWNHHRRGDILEQVERMGDEEGMQFIDRALEAAGMAGGMVGGVGVGMGLGSGSGGGYDVAPSEPAPDAPTSYSFGMNAAAGFLQKRGVDLTNEATEPQVMMILEKMSQIDPGWENDPLAMEWFENIANGLRLQQELLKRAGMGAAGVR